MAKQKLISYLISIAVIAILVFAVVIVLNHAIPLPVSKSVSALEINMADESHCMERTLEINGTYYWNLWDHDRFSGMIAISGYEYANGDYAMADLISLGEGEESSLEYRVSPNDPDLSKRNYLFGSVYAKPAMENTVILVFEHKDGSFGDIQYSTADGTVIVAGAKDRSQAYEIVCDYFWPNE